MRLPLNPAQWGAYIIQSLLQQLPVLEPYVQFARILGNDAEGNGYGVIPVNNAVVPFVVREFDLKPLDTLLVHSNGEIRSTFLSEPNLMFVFNNVTLGAAIDKIPDTVDRDVFLDMMPGYVSGQMGGRGRGTPQHVQRSITRVKLSSLLSSMPDDALQAVHEAVKAASADHQSFMRCVINVAHAEGHRFEKKASALDKLMTFDPRPTGQVEIGINGEFDSMAMKAAASLLREMGAAPQVADLMGDKLVVVDLRDRTKEAKDADPHFVNTGAVWSEGVGHLTEQVRQHRAREASRPVTDPGWYDLNVTGVDKPLTGRVFNCTKLDGAACNHRLAVTNAGYMFDAAQRWTARPSVVPTPDEVRSIYTRSRMLPGELCFILNNSTGEATVPFVLNAKTELPGGVTSLTVTPKLTDLGGPEQVVITFGKNLNIYRVSTSEIAYPAEGYSIFTILPTRVFSNDATPVSAGALGRDAHMVKVKVFKGGGVWSLAEDGKAAEHGLTRGRLVQRFITRYGMSAERALDVLNDLAMLKYDAFEAVIAYQTAAPTVQHEPIKLAMDIWAIAKAAAGEMNPDLNRSGPNADPTNAPGQSGVGAPGTGLDTSAGIGPEVDGLAEIADMLVGFAASELPEDEMLQLNSELTSALDDAQNLIGRLLMLVRLGKIKSVTESEAQRVFRECDKFRSNMVNSSVSRGRFVSPMT